MDDSVRFMSRAIELARQGMRCGDGGPFGAVVVRDGEIIAIREYAAMPGKRHY